MGTNWIIVSIVILAVTGLIIFLIVRNQKDEKDVTTSLDKDLDTEDDYERDKERE